MRPLRSFLLLLIFLACFTGLHYIFPNGSLFPSLSEFIPGNLTDRFYNKETTPEILPVKVGIVIPVAKVDTAHFHPVDSIVILQGNSSKPSAGIPIHPAGNADLKIMIDSLAKKGRTRILYYGDSQLEGDRITSYLRENLRHVLKGTGPGLFLPLMPVMYTKTIWIRSSPGWARYNFLSYQKKEISHRKLGPFMTVCRYLPEGTTEEEPVKASVRITPAKSADEASSVYEKLRIFYRNTEGRVEVKISEGKREIFADSLKRGNAFNELSCNLGGIRDVMVEFSGRVSPDIFAMSIESDSGVIVDNIPQRGSAGLEFTMVDRKNLRDSYLALAPDLIVLQYGLNIVRNVSNDYSYYMRGLERQLELLKEVAPGIPVLLVGLTDMGLQKGDSAMSFPNITSIIKAQKEAAIEANISFWDAWASMGGKNSIVRWSEMKPPLAQKDLTHLTYEGADTLSRRMIDSLFISSKPVRAKVAVVPVKIPVVTSSISTRPSGKNRTFTGEILRSVFSYDPSKPLIFSASSFWLFLLIVLAGYSLIYRRLFLRNFYLLLVSLFFYYKSGGIFLFLLVLVTVVDYTSGLAIGYSRKKRVRKLFIILSIISNIGILAYFKYTGFIIATLNELLGTHFPVYDFLADFSNRNLGTVFNISNIILPVGISFFTFQSLSYTIDVYRRKIKPVKNIIDFGFYVSFFPQLVAGPIVRASEFIPQIYSKFHLDKREFSHALYLISKGLIKKIIISDFIAINLIDRIFDAPAMFSGFENLMAIYGYGLQIYCDFSGYTDIAIGVGLLFGFRLPVNFNSPYKAEGISDFWKRWHISLSRWLKDYLYIPLGGNRKGKIRTYINLLLTMLIGGLWHGASLRFIIWGALHGAGLVVDRLWHLIFPTKQSGGGVRRFISIFITFQFVSFCWIFFRAPDIESIRVMFSQVALNFSPGSWTTVLQAYSMVFFLIGAGYLLHFLPEKTRESYRGLFIKIPLAAQMAIILVIAVMLFQMRSTEVMPFIYFRF